KNTVLFSPNAAGLGGAIYAEA
ncbi:hypothetical protein ACVS38_006598, partial [Pseudomonas aeruginosa]